MHLCGGGGGGGAIMYAHVWCACFLCFAWQGLGLFLSVVHGSVLACHARCGGVPMCCAGSQCKGRSKINAQKQNAKAKS